MQHWPDGEQRTLFAAKAKVTTKELGERLSQAIASAIIARLREWSGAPLAALELSYREHDRRVPILVPLTTEDHVSSLALSAPRPGAARRPLPPPRHPRSPASDLYALGATLVALLTRRAPHTLLGTDGRLAWRPAVQAAGAGAASLRIRDRRTCRRCRRAARCPGTSAASPGSSPWDSR